MFYCWFPSLPVIPPPSPPNQTLSLYGHQYPEVLLITKVSALQNLAGKMGCADMNKMFSFIRQLLWRETQERLFSMPELNYFKKLTVVMLRLNSSVCPFWAGKTVFIRYASTLNLKVCSSKMPIYYCLTSDLYIKWLLFC